MCKFIPDLIFTIYHPRFKLFDIFVTGLLGVSLLLGSLPVSADEVSIGLVADSYIDRDFPDSNYGGSTQLDAHYGIVGATDDGRALYVIRQLTLGFDEDDIAAIPDGATITSARLEAYLDSGDANTHVFIDVGYIYQAWDEMSVTWNSLGERYAWPRSPRITRHVGIASGWYDWDITGIVNGWRSGLFENHGLILMIYLEAGTPIEDYSRLFYSKEGNPELAPKLTIEYSLEAVEPIVDLTITNLEINQVVQVIEDPSTPTPDADNSVTLIAEKPTIVRLYVDSGPATDPVHGVTAYLYRVGGGSEERLSPLHPIIAVPSPDRENHHHTINFRLPTEWVQRNADFYAVINPPSLSTRVAESDYGNNRFPAGEGNFVDANFESEGRDMDIAWLLIDYIWSGWTDPSMADSRVEHQRTAAFPRTVFPVAAQNVTYRPWPGGGFDWNSNINSSSDDLINELNDIHNLSTTLPKPDFLYAWIPEGAYGGIGRSDPPYNSGAGIVAFGEDRDPNMLYRVIFTHELGHNLNQIGHTTLPDPRLSDGEYGYDVRHIDLLSRVVIRHYLDGGTSFDLIDYMRGGTSPARLMDGNHAWVTPHTYEAVHDELSPHEFYASFKAWYWKNIFPLLKLQKVEVKHMHESKADIGLKPEKAAKVLIVSGTIEKAGAGKFRPMYVLTDKIFDLSQSRGVYSVDLIDSTKKTLSSFRFNVNFYIDNYAGNPVERVPFNFTIPYIDGVKAIALKHEGDVYHKIEVSDHAPEIEIIYPDVKTTLTGSATVKWKAADKDGDSLTFSILYSRDGGDTWSALATGLTNTSYKLQTSKLPGSDNAFLRVMVTDGVNTAYADTKTPVMVEDKPPMAHILEPQDKTRTVVGTKVFLIGQAYDLEDGNLTGKSLRWVSNRDGELGSGRKIVTDKLSMGVHEIKLIATDSAGKIGSDQIILYVDRDWFSTDSDDYNQMPWIWIVLLILGLLGVYFWRFHR